MILSPRLIAESRNNSVYLVWHSGRVVQHADVKALISDVFFTRSTNNGASFGEIMNLSNYSGWSVDPQIAVSQDNNVYVVWTNNFQEKYGKVYFTRSTNNGASFGEIMNLSNYSGWSVDPQIAVSQDNNVYVVWTNNFQEKYGKVYFTRSTNNGASFGEIMNLSNYSGWSVDPQIAVSQDNNVYVVWTNNATGSEEILLKKEIGSNNKTCVNSNFGKLDNLDIEGKIKTKSARAVNIAIVQATFTDAAYDKSFYMFYEMYKSEQNRSGVSPNTTKYTDLLSSKLDQYPKTWSAISQIANHLKWLTPNSNIDILTDKDVHAGSLLFTQNGTNLYDVIILEHQEYVSQKEYNNLKKFVANGGVLILLNGNIFYGEVEYDNNTNTVKLVKGHGIAFNGNTAWKSVKERWKVETSQWVGSNYKCCFSYEFIFHNDPFGITHVEEQYITNPKAKILLDYNATINGDPRKFVIATYELDYKRGKVITLGIWTVNKLFDNDRFLRFFDTLLFQYALRE
jgi:hypothetical protein